MSELGEKYVDLYKEFQKLKSNSKYRLYAIFGAIAIIVFLFVGSCNRISKLNTKIAVGEQNQKALADSLRESRNKAGELEKSKNIFVAEKDELAKLSKDLADELQKERGKVRELNSIVANFKPETLYVDNNVVVEQPIDSNGVGIYSLDFGYDTTYSPKNYYKLEVTNKFKLDTNFNITPLGSKVLNNEIGFSLITGLREKDDNIEIFARSPHPYFNITEMEGAIIDPKKHPVIKKFTKPKKYSVGPYIGFGFGGDMKLGVHIGIGVTYSIIRF